MSTRARFALAGTILAIVAWYGVAVFCLVRDVTNQVSGNNVPGGSQMQAGPRSPDAGYLPVFITAVYPSCSPLYTPPWHTIGGDWTFFDCSAGNSGKIRFTIGLRPKPRTGNEPFVWREGLLGPADKQSGEDLVQLVSEAFHQPLPEKRTGRPVGYILLQAAVLESAQSQQPGGGFVSAPPGDWTTTKWFLDKNGYAAAVYFNYNLREMRCEFAEDNPSHRRNLLLQLAAGLRDGPLPERTPETDPNLTLAGPRFTDWQQVTSDRAGPAVLSADSRRLLYVRNSEDGPSVLGMVELGPPTSDREVARFNHPLDSLRPLPGDSRQLLAVEYVYDNTNKAAPDDRQVLRLIDTRTGAAEELRGAWGDKHLSLGANAVSTDGRFAAISQWVPRANGKTGDFCLHVLDLGTRRPVVLAVPNRSLVLASWKPTRDGLRALVYTGRSWDKDQAGRRAFLADPLTGGMESDPTPLAELDSAWMRSPDGLWKAEVQNEERLVITRVATGSARTFTFDGADRGYLEDGGVVWANSRYIMFSFGRPVLIDAETLKMNYPTPRNENIWPMIFTPDFTRVIGRGGGFLYVGRVVMP